MKTLKIQIKDKTEFKSDLIKAARLLDRGQRVKTQKGMYFESLEAVRNILTEKRLNVWRAIRDQKPNSILELSKILKRGFRVVHSDVELLEIVGLIALKEEAGTRGKRKRPFSLADKVEFQVV